MIRTISRRKIRIGYVLKSADVGLYSPEEILKIHPTHMRTPVHIHAHPRTTMHTRTYPHTPEAFQRTKKEDLEFAKGIFRKAKIILD